MSQESEAPIKLPSASVVKALFAEANKVKEQLSSISGSFGDRIKTQIEVGNLCGPAFRQAASIFKKARNNELKAKEHLYHLRAYLDWVEEDMFNKGHVGDIATKYLIPGETAEGALLFVPSEAIYAELHATQAPLVEEPGDQGVYGHGSGGQHPAPGGIGCRVWPPPSVATSQPPACIAGDQQRGHQTRKECQSLDHDDALLP